MNKLSFSSHTLRWALGSVVALLVLVLLVIFFFPWNLVREPLNRYVSAQLGRRFEITERLDVHIGRTVTVHMQGLEVANPEWATDPYLVKASSAEFDVEVWPLLAGKLVMPRVVLTKPRIGLQKEADGRMTWALARDTSRADMAPQIGSLQVDDGSLVYRAEAEGANIVAQFSLADASAGFSPADAAAVQLPLSYKASGTWRKEVFSAYGRAGGVLQFGADEPRPFPAEINAMVGKTRLKAAGTVASLKPLMGIDATFDLQGRNLDELYKLVGVVLPSTPPYRLRGKLAQQGRVWAVSGIRGTLGESDLNGDLRFDPTPELPLLTGKLNSRVLDFSDLGPLIGVGTHAAAARDKSPTRKVLPTATLDVTRFRAMNADVSYSAAAIRHVKELPLDKGSARILLKDGVLTLDPLALGVAGGTINGQVKIDANAVPAAFGTRLDVRALQLGQILPAVETSRSSLGKISGQVALDGRGNSVAQMLGSASGDVSVLTGRGQISNILLEYMGLDGGEIIKFLISGDRNVNLRCAAVAFGVKKGVMTSRAIVLDTTDTEIHGEGQISLADETLDLLLKPQPKDQSILSLRSPLRIRGTFAAPTAGPDKAALAGRVGLAVALGFINPLLALAATIETGPGQDADCQQVLAQAAKKGGVVPSPSAVKP